MQPDSPAETTAREARTDRLHEFTPSMRARGRSCITLIDAKSTEHDAAESTDGRHARHRRTTQGRAEAMQNEAEVTACRQAGHGRRHSSRGFCDAFDLNYLVVLSTLNNFKALSFKI